MEDNTGDLHVVIFTLVVRVDVYLNLYISVGKQLVARI